MRKRWLALTALVLGAVLATLAADTVSGDDPVWQNERDRLPWRYGYSMKNADGCTPRQTTEGCNHTGSELYAIDFNGGTLPDDDLGWPLGAVEEGTIDYKGIDSGDCGFGYTVGIKGKSGRYYRYSHLDSFYFSLGVGQTIFQGGIVGYVGGSGCDGVKVYWAHLHFTVYSNDGIPWVRSAISIDWTDLSQHNLSEFYMPPPDDVRDIAHPSYNAGVGFDSADNRFGAIISGYQASGRWPVVGSPADVTTVWSPCRYLVPLGMWTPWTYTCDPPENAYGGQAQTYFGPSNRQRAVMDGDAVSGGFLLKQAILAAYTECWEPGGSSLCQSAGGTAKDWVYWMGYPIDNLHFYAPQQYIQNFEGGYVIYTKYTGGTCDVNMYLNAYGGWVKTYGWLTYCDHP